jgi:hypothetical protein
LLLALIGRWRGAFAGGFSAVLIQPFQILRRFIPISKEGRMNAGSLVKSNLPIFQKFLNGWFL